MITKEQCVVGTKVVVNNQKSKWNIDLGSTRNGIVNKVFNDNVFGVNKEVVPGTTLTIVSKPKKRNNINTVLFTIEGDDTVYSTYWICFKSKVDLYNK